MPERAQVRDSSLETQRQESPLEKTSVTAILLKMAERFSTGNFKDSQGDDPAQSLESIDYFHYELDYTPYTFDYSYFQIENYGQTDNLAVHIPAGIQEQLKERLDLYGLSLTDPENHSDWQEIKHKIELEKYYLEKSVISSMMAYAYSNEPNSQKAPIIWELVTQNRYSVL